MLKGSSEYDDFEYKIDGDLANSISLTLNECKKNRISENALEVNYSPKGIEIFLDGEKIDYKNGIYLIYKRKITLIEEKDNKVRIDVEVNNIENNKMARVLERCYLVESKELSNYIDELY